MPAKVKVKILACRNLPIMDRSNETTDAFVEVKLCDVTFKTEVKRKTLNPVFNSSWFRFEIDDLEIQDEILTMKVMDYDTYTANDAIGKVSLSLNPLLLQNEVSRGMNGWIPIYDTMNGIRGEINFIVKVELFSDSNKFRQSSCGVQFFNSNGIPHGYHAIIRGFVEELAIDDDPEHDWIDKIRRAASSNEARQIAFMKLAGQIQRKMGLKAINMGGNAVVGFRQHFDLEKDTIVARGIGTCVTLVKIQSELSGNANSNNIQEDENEQQLSTSPSVKMHARTESIGCKFPASPSKNVSGSLGKDQTLSAIHRRSSDSDLSCTPKGNSLTPGYDPRNARIPSSVLKPLTQESMDMLEYPFLTLSKYPNGFIVHFGATVSARSVKLMEKAAEKDEIETRDAWFNELRMEIRGHAKSLGCNVILGYSESTTISDDVTILSATGTAAIINLQYASEFVVSGNSKDIHLTTSTNEAQVDDNTSKNGNDVEEKTNGDDNHEHLSNSVGGIAVHAQSSCSLCHIPYSKSSTDVGGAIIGKCCICKRGNVPDVILATIELPDDLSVVGVGTLIQASVCRPKRDLRSESNAKEISDGLPFLEYELHRLLINKLKVKGMNAIFRLSVKVTVGDKMMALLATGTAVYLAALHPSVAPKIVAGNSWNESAEKLAEFQKSIQTTVERNRETYQLHNIHHHHADDVVKNLNKNLSDNDDSDNDEKLDYARGNKQTCILEIDDIQDLELFSMLMEPSSPEGIQIVNAQTVPGHGHDSHIEHVKNLQMFTQVWRTKIPSTHQSNSSFSRKLQKLLQSIFFKLRGAVPCTICEIQFQLDLPADDIQLLITGMVLKTVRTRKMMQSLSHEKKMDDDMMFSLEACEEESTDATEAITPPNHHNKVQKKNSGHSLNSRVFSKNDKFVDISPLSYVPSGKIEKYLGNLHFSFIRETQNVRDYGGTCGFVHSFITELLAIVRAQIAALGGNLMVAFWMDRLVLVDNPHKNQAQCLIQVGGDAVYVTYSDEN